MEEILSCGTSINNPRLSEQDIIVNHGILRMLEEQTKCKFGVPTQDGSRFSDTSLITSALLTQELMESALKFNKEKMRKDNQLFTLTDQSLHNKDGELFMLMRQRKSQLKELIKTLVSISTDHSTSDQDCQ